MKNNVTMYAIQSKKVLEIILNEGIVCAKFEYVDKKYGDVSWIFKEWYKFFSRRANKIVEKPKECETPVWIHKDSKMCGNFLDTPILKLSVPLDEVVLFDNRMWNKVQNLSYLGNSKEEELKFDKKLKERGINHSTDVFEKPFYILEKAEIKKSWYKLFKYHINEGKYVKIKETSDIFKLNDTYIDGAIWKLKKEWIENIEEIENYVKKMNK